MKLSVLRRNTKSTDGCIWEFQSGQRVGEPTANLCFLIAERDNPKHRAASARLQLEHVEALRAGGEKQAEAWRKIQTRALAEAVLLGWWNLDDDAGQPIAYSADEAEKLLAASSLWPVRNFVEDASSTLAGYRSELEEQAKGN